MPSIPYDAGRNDALSQLGLLEKDAFFGPFKRKPPAEAAAPAAAAGDLAAQLGQAEAAAPAAAAAKAPAAAAAAAAPAGDMVEQVARAEGSRAARRAAGGAKPGLLKGMVSKITPGRALGVGALTGGALLANHILSDDRPQVAVTPSAPIAPMFP